MNHKRQLLAAGVIAACALGASPASAKVTIGVSMATFDDNWLTILREAMGAEAKAQGVEVQFEDGQKDIVRQLSQVENFIAQKVDAIIVNPTDTAATRNITARVSAAGIPLIYVNRKPDETPLPARVVFVGSDETVAGRLECEYLANTLKGKGNVAIMLGELAHNATAKRTESCKQALAKFPGIKVVAEQTANFERTQAMNLMSNWITAGMPIDAIASNNDEMAIGALMAMQQAGIPKGKVLVGGIDATPDALMEMKKGTLTVTVFQDAHGQGKESVDAALSLVKGEHVDADVWVPFQQVTPENYTRFLSK